MLTKKLTYCKHFWKHKLVLLKERSCSHREYMWSVIRQWWGKWSTSFCYSCITKNQVLWSGRSVRINLLVHSRTRGWQLKYEFWPWAEVCSRSLNGEETSVWLAKKTRFLPPFNIFWMHISERFSKSLWNQQPFSIVLQMIAIWLFTGYISI